jgi:hypothetical protein
MQASDRIKEAIFFLFCCSAFSFSPPQRMRSAALRPS